MKTRISRSFVLVFPALIALVYAYILFGYQRRPVVIQSPAAVAIQGESIEIAVTYTRTADLPGVVYAGFERLEDGLTIQMAAAQVAGPGRGNNKTIHLVIDLPCLPPGQWIRRARIGYDVLGNGWLWRWAEYQTDPFLVSGDLSKAICR